MIPVEQLRVDIGNGDCLRACICSILEIPNSPSLPNVGESRHHLFQWNDLLRPFGVLLEWDATKIWRDGYWIASVPSKNLPAPTTHAVVMHGFKVAHDPSTKWRYPMGQDMLGSDLVLGGHYFVLNDPSKFAALGSGLPKQGDTE